jgi:AraC family transcriptional regulator, transcriptional activator of pobA
MDFVARGPADPAGPRKMCTGSPCGSPQIFSGLAVTYASLMGPATALPLFHLYGDPPDDQAFDFIHVETIASRSSIHEWTIRAHRHRNLFQILLIEQGGGEMTFEAATLAFQSPCAILVPSTMAHGFRFHPAITDGWVVSFTEDVAGSLGDPRGEALAGLKALAADPVVPLPEGGESKRLSAWAAELHEERFLARAGFRIAMRGLLALIAVEVGRLAAGRARVAGADAAGATDITFAALRKLVEENFQRERQLTFYAERLAMTVDRLNDHVKRATGVTAGHLIRQRVLTEARRQLVFTNRPIHEIAHDLAFSDPSHFARFFRKQTGTTPHDFRAAQGG